TSGEHIVADKNERDARRRKILLRTCVDQRVLSHVDRTAKYIRRRVSHQRHIAHLRVVLPLYSVNRFVGGYVNVGGFGIELDLILPGYPGEVIRFSRSGDGHLTDSL